MEDLGKILLTILGGILIFVSGQIVVKFLIEPIQEQRKLIGEIAGSINFYSNVGAKVEQHYYDQIKLLDQSDDPQKNILIDRYTQIIKNHWQRSDESAQTLRRLATDLLGKTNSIPFYDFLSKFRVVLSVENIVKSSSHLISMSNSSHGQFSSDNNLKCVVNLLKLGSLAKQYGMEPEKTQSLKVNDNT